MKELLFKLFSGAIENVGESKLEEVLDELYAKDPEMYRAAVLGGNQLVKALQPHVEASKTQIDDIVLSAIGDAIRDSAARNGVELPAAA